MKQRKNISDEAVLLQTRWFSLWNLPDLDLYEGSHCCQVWLMTVVLSRAVSCYSRCTFFSFDVNHRRKIQPNQIWPLDNMCDHHCTMNSDWLVTSCDDVDPETLFYCMIFTPKVGVGGSKKREEQFDCVKTITICSAKQQTKQSKFTLTIINNSLSRRYCPCVLIFDE